MIRKECLIQSVRKYDLKNNVDVKQLLPFPLQRYNFAIFVFIFELREFGVSDRPNISDRLPHLDPTMF